MRRVAPGPATVARRPRPRPPAADAGESADPLVAADLAARAGHAAGVGRDRLAALRRGDLRPDARVDLHGLARDEAERAVTAALAGACARGARVLLVVHGHAQERPGAGVLRDALPRWLGGPALRRFVLAFVPAPPRDGGAGATLVLLRRAARVPGRAGR